MTISRFLSVPLLGVALAAVPAPCAEPDQDVRVHAMLDAWHAAAASADEPAYFGAFADDGVFFGTDATERWTTDEFRTWAAPFFERGRAWTLVPVERNVFLDAKQRIAWFDEELWTEHLGECRGTGVCSRDGGGVWRIEQYNLSIPVPNDIADEVIDKAEATTERHASLTLDAMSFNIRYDTQSDGPNAWEHRHDLVTDLIRTERPDVLGVQEALLHQRDALLEALPLYASIGVGRDDGIEAGEFSPILYLKGRFEVTDSGTFWLSDTPEAPGSASWGNAITRICTWARFVDRATEQGVYVFNTHLDHRSAPSRAKAVELIERRINGRAHKDDRVILMGDLNAGPDSPPLHALFADGWRSALVALDPDEHAEPGDGVGNGTFNAWRGRSDGPMIDHILVRTGAAVLDAAIVRTARDGRYPSDHYPVTARIRLDRDGTPADEPPAP